MLLEKIFDLQSAFYKEHGEMKETNHKLKKLYLAYSEKYKNSFKKASRLKEALESNHIKRAVANFVNKESIKTSSEILGLNKLELKLFESMFEGRKENEDTQIPSTSNRKDKMVNLLVNIFSNENSHKKLPDHLKYEVGLLLLKEGRELKECEVQIIQEPIVIDSPNSVIKFHSPLPSQDGDILYKFKMDSNSSAIHAERKEGVEGILEEKLKIIYHNKSIPVVEFIKTSDNQFMYGTFKVSIELDREGLKSKSNF